MLVMLISLWLIGQVAYKMNCGFAIIGMLAEGVQLTYRKSFDRKHHMRRQNHVTYATANGSYSLHQKYCQGGDRSGILSEKWKTYVQTADLLVLLGYFLAMLLIGAICACRVKKQEDYFMGGRGFGKLLQTLAAFGAGTGSQDPINVGRTVWTSGLIGVWTVLIVVALLAENLEINQDPDRAWGVASGEILGNATIGAFT